MELNKFDALQIGLASPEKIREWSRGEVKKPETINYRTLKPEKDGLFCERIFGPIKDWECHCGKYKRVRYKGIVCDRCGVEVTKSKVRRERMGHIELAAPVSHIWYFKGIPSRMGLILDMSPRALEKVLYFASYLVLDPKETPLLKKQLLNEKEYREAADKYGEESFEAGMGAESIKKLLQEIDLNQLGEELKENLKTSTGQKRVRIIRRLEVVESFRKSTNKPEWMIMDVVPVIPPDLRPMVQLDGGRFATSDLNDLYRRVINRNNRLKKLLDLGAPDIIVRNEKRMLQEAVDALIDNGRRGRPVTGPGNRPLKSLSDMLKGKQGRFRQNLLGKRVDYSGRSVIVVGPDLKMYQCGLPKEMALELFKPFVMKKLVETGAAHNIKSAKRMVERVQNQVWDVLEEVISDHPVMLNRAPTLHRLGIQAFQPILVEGRAIKLHPLACTAYNADFDGDQMAVHVPLSVEAQAESRFLMLAAHNILKPSDGKPVCVPTQDMVLGSYYLTIDKDGVKGEGKAFTNVDEALMAYQLGEIDIHAKIKVRLEKEMDGSIISGIIDTTIGKLIFNESIPQDLGFIDRSVAGNELLLEIDFLVGKKNLGGIIDKCYRKHGPTKTSIMLDKIKAKGYHYSTISAITVSTSDMTVPPNKKNLMSEAEASVEKIEKMYRRGFISDDERYERVISTWTKTTESVADALMDNLDQFNPIFMMADSGARGSKSQIKQLAGMRGLMANPSGRIIELPIKASFREGLDVLEYFISTHGARKGNADTALKTADSGYLTRRLVDVSQDVIVRIEDCGAKEGFEVSEIKEGNEVIESLSERLIGRYTAEDIIDPTNKEVIVKQNEYVDEDKALRIEKVGVKKVKIRSVFTCDCKYGVCAKCYGMDMGTAQKISIGEAVGIVAAQSIGEPGTQLTMRTFHTGGVAGSDITQGLPRVEELFEARKPKGLAIVSEVSGTVRIEETKKKRIVYVATENGEEVSYDIPFGSSLKVKNGQNVSAGDEITEGSVNPHDIIRIKGVNAVKNYLLSEVQKVYRLQGVDINDKHLEVVVRQMTRKVKVEDSGDTELLPGTMIDIFDFKEENQKIEEKGGKPAEARVSLLGITKAALATDSFLSAASFQETTRVLTDAAIKGKSDPLVGLKENVTIGKLIPAGTGMTRYKSIEIDPVVTEKSSDDEGFMSEDKIEG
ncbi:DNA-directed RNA polymerase subunit beta' [Clostridium felsineum]|uniref:DNA-directed RNA polymerase subunit beta' n=1 Tax=Clostridium felsineum TaxID=36839 RepID=UPI00098C72D5|nr:DNA-directed RNA polymerase subunit beta' [Clostridium felsineum]MCR3758024.1 DNA-directed RNA polymerase subunit beta' [Clostridium felsineum]URZ03463.1 DNA-directed RNA polymerase subunit beta' [Clostridium felsineum]URZ14767.1 DNA-directed RNA polymerase subunit beta' [Clostridium felsineum DSM 794]